LVHETAAYSLDAGNAALIVFGGLDNAGGKL
jgi:hypothetical protein